MEIEAQQVSATLYFAMVSYLSIHCAGQTSIDDQRSRLYLFDSEWLEFDHGR